ncbi:hypothetical protein [Virgibacillus ainsalahensis]
MNEDERMAIKKLMKKVQQHEETITQLVEIIAATNRRITDIGDREQNKQQKLPLS